jgi:hypothetical protein
VRTKPFTVTASAINCWRGRSAIAQDRNSARFATYKRWSELGRQVQKGQKAIALVMPVTINKKDADGNKTDDIFQMFVMKNNWFVLSQTEGKDYANEVKTAEWGCWRGNGKAWHQREAL